MAVWVVAGVAPVVKAGVVVRVVADAALVVKAGVAAWVVVDVGVIHFAAVRRVAADVAASARVAVIGARNGHQALLVHRVMAQPKRPMKNMKSES